MPAIPALFPGRAAVVVGTGPSLTDVAVEQCAAAGLVVVTVNRTWEFIPLALEAGSARPCVHVTVNPGWWDKEGRHENDFAMLRNQGDAECWCSDPATSERYGLNHFGWTDDAEARGLSADPENVALGHSSGFSALNIAFLMGCNPILLLGHDMRFPKGYHGPSRVIGEGKRHYFGEYGRDLQHWPSMRVGGDGTLNGLLDCYAPVAEQLAEKQRHVEIINCTPGSALKYFPCRNLEETLEWIQQRR